LSDYGLRATLLQHGQLVAFASRSLSSVEQRYTQIEKETLAMVFACERIRQCACICGRDFIHIQTDHKPLETISKKSLLSTLKRLQSVRLRLQHYNLAVSYTQAKTCTLLTSFHVHHCPSNRRIELCQKMCLRRIC